jgi:hypothetical protein
MPKVVNSRLVDIVAVKTNIYMPIVEAIANSIDAIEERKAKDGEIRVELKRNPQLITSGEDATSPVSSITIKDNGIGFTDENTDSFDELFSEKKLKIGGKGFGRFTYLKYFTSTSVDSTYKIDDKWKNRKFTFYSDRNEFITNPEVTDTNENKYRTTVVLNNIKKQHQNKLNLKLDTIARKLFEVLLPYFVTDGYNPPKIVIVDTDERDEVTLNDYLKDHNKIQLLYNEKLDVKGMDDKDEPFQVKIFKIFHSQSNNRVALTAHHREVLSTAMQQYDPEFFSGFTETKKDGADDESASGNYVIKAYVIGDYLDKHVSIERGAFNFQDEDETALYPISKKNIEKTVTKLAASHFKQQLEPLKNKKIERIKAAVDENMPWNKSLLRDLDYDTVPYNASDKDIDTAVNKIAYDKEQEVRVNVQELLRSDNATEIDQKVAAIAQEVTELGKGKLAHYVALRRAILDVFEKSLKLKDTNKHELENIVHKIIFPLKTDTDTVSYESHNLWLLDERLSFSEYVASDKPLNTSDERPDLLSFDRPIAVREGDELSNPITIFELKRPGRTAYSDADNPLKQVSDYVKKIRSGNYTNPQGRPVSADENTPAFCFVVCDLTPKIIEFCELYNLTRSPDKESFYGFHSNFKIYFEVISFNKVLKDSKQRNKVFFRKLGIE